MFKYIKKLYSNIIYKIKSLFNIIIDYNLLNKSAFGIKTLLCFIWKNI